MERAISLFLRDSMQLHDQNCCRRNRGGRHRSRMLYLHLEFFAPFPRDESPLGYLYRSVHNNALKYLRDKNVDNQRLQRWSKEQDDVEDVDFYQAVEEELIRKLHVVIDQLPEQRKNILLLSIDGLTVQEIADQLNISINTVKTQKKRAYVFLKENLKQSLLLIYILEILK